MGNGMETVKEVSLNVIGWETKFCPLQHISTEKGSSRLFVSYVIIDLSVCQAHLNNHE